MKRLAAIVGGACLALMLLAFEERQAEAAVEALRARLGPAVERIRDAVKPTQTIRPAAGSAVLVGTFPARAEAPGGDLRLEGARLIFERAPALRTRPHRIAYGREAPLRTLGLPDAHQIELRQVVAADARIPVAASPLCGGAVPGWIALTRHDSRLELLVWPVGPAPDEAANAPAPCGRFTHDGPAG